MQNYRPGKRSPASGSQPRHISLVLLAIAAGCVDAVSYLGLAGVLTAAMTGNTILLGLAVGLGELPAAVRSCVALAGFMLGAILAAIVTARGARDVAWPRAVTASFALEFIVLVIFALGWRLAGDQATANTAYLYPLIGAAGIAMGIQSATVHRLGVAGVSTTYITGTLTSSAIRLVAWLRTLGDVAAAPVADPTQGPTQSGQTTTTGGPGYSLLVWLAYGAGAAAAGAVKLWWPSFLLVTGTAIDLRWPSAALLLPMSLVAMVIVMAVLRHRQPRLPEQ